MKSAGELEEYVFSFTSFHNRQANLSQHVLGSQVFDYWFDPSRFVVVSIGWPYLELRSPKLTPQLQEHYADGDLVNRDTPISKVQAGPEALSVWGPPVPEVF